jgi:hypothetical protein
VVYSTKVWNIWFRGEYYEAGEIRIVEEEKTIGVSKLKKTLRSSELIPVGHTTYGDSTKISVDGLKLRINDLSFDIIDKATYDQITDIVNKPYSLERERREKIVKTVDTSVINFLLERAKAMEDLRELSVNPREAIMRKLERVGEGEDPVTQFRGMLSQSLIGPYSEMESNLLLLKPIISEVNMQRVYAMIFGVASVQEAMLRRADPSKPLELLGKVAAKKLTWEATSGSAFVDATKSLYSEIAVLSPDVLLGKN